MRRDLQTAHGVCLLPPKSLPSLTRSALQTEKLQQNERLARLGHADLISFALSVPLQSCTSVIIA